MTEIVLVQKVVSKVFGDFVSKVVSDGVDVLKSAIKDADLDRKSYNQNLQTRLYQLIVDALNRFTYNKYEKQDKLYDAAESILKGYISTKDNTDAVKSGLKMLASGVNNDACQEFLETLCGEICRDDNSDLYKEIDMLWKRRESEYISGEFTKIGQNDKEILEQLNDLREVLDFIKRNMNRQEGDKSGHNGIPIVNRAEEYVQRWDENVFLNNFNKEDENAGVNIKLSEIYIEECLPHYIWKNNNKTSDKLRNLLTQYIINNNKRKMLLILGQPGIGKSTLITWIMSNLAVKKDGIFIYQFATDLDCIDWQSKNILKGIFLEIGLGTDELEGKTLILDGFDEIYISSDRERILNKLNQDLKRLNTLKSFSMIITCRENYVYNLKNIDCDYIVLQAWNEVQIEKFCRTYWEKCENDISEDIIQKILENKEIFGIPLILYMILALNIAIEKSSSIVDVYDQIFSLEKGVIYDRCYDLEHRINNPEIKEHIYRISQNMAFWIFEYNADKASISQEKFAQICDNEMSNYGEKREEIQSDTLIGNFFKLKHCEGKGTKELQFVHRSIYEYLVVEYFFDSLHGLKSEEEIAGELGELLKYGYLSPIILKFAKYKFDSVKGYDLSKVTKEVFGIMLQDGMTYHMKLVYSNNLFREMNIFSNMLEVVHLWNPKIGRINDIIVLYLRHNNCMPINLAGIDLEGADLEGANLENAKLEGASLRKANLREIKLRGANLENAKLEGANLGEADLRETYLGGAKLRGANLENARLEGADLRETDLRDVNLEGAWLRDVNLIWADLKGANLFEADFRGAYLIGADLSEEGLIGAHLVKSYLKGKDLIGADLFEVDLKKVIFDEKQVIRLYERYDLSNSLVYLFETDEIISYEEYCRRIEKKDKMNSH